MHLRAKTADLVEEDLECFSGSQPRKNDFPNSSRRLIFVISVNQVYKHIIIIFKKSNSIKYAEVNQILMQMK